MKQKLVEMSLFQLLSNEKTSEHEELIFISAYENFAEWLMTYSAEEEFASLMQILGYARVEFLFLKEKMSCGLGKKCID